MINESWPWKRRLAKDADIIERWAAKPKITDRRSFLLEEKIFLAAYAMRKLVEANKLSSSFEGSSINCRIFPPISDEITAANHHKIDELYDFSRVSRRTIGARDLLDLVIHSFVFAEALGDDHTVDGFLITSDRRRYNFLWFIHVPEFTHLMRKVASDYPSTVIQVFDQGVNDWFSWRGKGEPPQCVRRKIERIRASTRA